MSAPLDFIDTTLRDGNQSLWGAVGLRTGMMLEIAADMDRVGYRAIDFSTSTHMADGAFSQRKPVGAHSPDEGAHAPHTTQLFVDRHALHLVGDGPS